MSKREELRDRLRKHSRKTVAVDVGGGETYTIRSLTMREKGENDLVPVNVKTASVDTSKLSRQKCELLCLSVIDDEDKQPLFAVDEWQVWEDVAAPVAARLLTAIDALNEGEEVAGLVKNSEPTGD